MLEQSQKTNETMIHPTAIVSTGATLGEGVAIGAYSVVGSHVTLGDGVHLHAHVNVDGHTTIGEGTQIFPFASVGTIPQDLKYNGEESRLVIGKRNIIREHVTINTGTADDRMETTIGDDCLFMVGAHVAHDCVVGNHVIMANNATLAGHVQVGDFAILGGLAAVRQFAKIGEHAMIGGLSGIENDVLPYSLIKGDRASLQGLNLIGLERRGFDKEKIKQLRKAYADIFSQDGVLKEKLQKVSADHQDNELIQAFVDFALNESTLGVCQPRKG